MSVLDLPTKGPPCKTCGRPMTWYWWAPGACEYLCDHCTGGKKS